jgi:crotonobetainyl-CoA:carnitine CoA-transferase CaiB-like acyl-CoA transferase
MNDAVAPAASGPLQGMRILDLGTMIAGPVACTLLADFGAEVIKIEEPQAGDALRHIGPFEQGESLFWNVEARNKKSVTLDLKQPAGRALLLRLVAKADAVVENFRPGVMARLGLAYEDLRQVNPRIVLLSVSGFGQTGPYAARAGYDRIAQAFGGLLHITGFPDRPPVRPGVSIADYQTALFGALSLMMALHHRDARGGPGQHIDLALYESVYRFTDVLTAAYDRLGQVRQRQGNLGLAAAPGDHFPTRDGRWLVLTISNDPMFRKLCEAMGRADLADDGRYATHALRWKHIADINAEVGDWILSQDVGPLCDTLDAFGLAYSLTLSIDEICADPHYRVRGSIQTVDHPRLGALRMQGVGPRFSASPAGAIRAAPGLGQHNREVLGGLGVDDAELAELARTGVILSAGAAGDGP